MFRCSARLIYAVACLLLALPALSQSVSFSSSSLQNPSNIHADFNSDGREDFVLFGSSNLCSTSAFALVLSTGDGTYASPVCYRLPDGGPESIAIGDFNADGNADLIVGNGSIQFYQYVGSPSGRLHLQATYTNDTVVQNISAADVNHDGKIDLLFNSGGTANDFNLHVWFGNGDGTFTTGPSTPMLIFAPLFIGDFDGDGKADVVTEYNLEGSTYQVFYGDGTGHFVASAPFSDNVQYAVYDLNGDGKSDLVGEPFDFSVSGNTYYNQVKVMYGNADRTFTTNTITLATCDAWLFPPASADLNGDGTNDIAVAEASDCNGTAPDTFNVLLGNSNGTYQPEQAIYTGTSSQLLAGFLVARANRDSKPDIVLFDISSGTSNVPATLFENTTTGSFPACAPPNRYTGITLCAPTSTVVASSPVAFSVGAANQTPGRKVEVWIDGKKMSEQLKDAFSYYSFLDASYSLSNGTHKVTVYAAGWDNLLQSSSFTLTVGSTTCAAPLSAGVNVCSPINNATVGSSVLAWASGAVSGTVSHMDVFVDGVKQFSTSSNTLKTNLSLASGTHKFIYDIVNTAGQRWSQAVFATVP